ncbi:MAG: hypothetical protein INQ03_13745 [Candidatus Heimdallarchaeota archaeon]|nr:hypothetical protein [Candidatus Heimdallarchaeota archaeon]
MRTQVFFLFVLLLIIIPVSASRDEVSIDTIKLVYENRFNQGSDIQLKVQINFNASYAEVLIDKDLETTVIYSAYLTEWVISDWIEIKVDGQLFAEAGEYQGRVIAKHYNRSYPAQTLFFSFDVVKVFNDTQILIATSLIGLIVLLPYFYNWDKQRVEKMRWNNIFLKEYLRIRFMSKKLIVVYVLLCLSLAGYFAFRGGLIVL